MDFGKLWWMTAAHPVINTHAKACGDHISPGLNKLFLVFLAVWHKTGVVVATKKPGGAVFSQ